MRFAVQLCDEVYEYVESLIENLLWDEIGDEFPNLAVSLKDEARGMMMGARDKITEVIESYISAEESILYTQNHDYMAQIRERSAVLKRQLTAQLSVERQKQQGPAPRAPAARPGADEGGAPPRPRRRAQRRRAERRGRHALGRAHLDLRGRRPRGPARPGRVGRRVRVPLRQRRGAGAARGRVGPAALGALLPDRRREAHVRHGADARAARARQPHPRQVHGAEREERRQPPPKTMGLDPAFVGRRAKERVYSRMQHCLEHLNEAEIGGK